MMIEMKRMGRAVSNAAAAAGFAALFVGASLADPAEASGATAPRLQPVRCWFDTAEAPSARCLRLYVPENRTQPGSRDLALAVVVLPPDGAAAGVEPDPILYLAGGPGYGAGIDAAGIDGWLSWRADVPWLLGRTLVLVDPRGTGLSEPLMSCPEIVDAYYSYYARYPRRAADGAAETAMWRSAGIACRDRLGAAGVDLAAYDSAAVADDLEELRVALGYHRWDVWGVSHGTRLALVLMRDHPAGIRSAVLDSLYPPEAMGYAGLAGGIEAAFRQLFTDCAADAKCARTHPDLEGDLARTLAWLDARPISFSVSRADTGEMTRLVLDGARFLDMLFGDFYDWQRITHLPTIIDRAARRDIRFLRAYAEWMADSLADPEFSDGLQLSMECREEFPFNPVEEMRAARAALPFAGFGRPRLELAVCPIWGAGTADSRESERVESPLPTLVLAGLYDPVTPPAWARAAMAGLPNGHLVEFAGIGHAVIDNDTCADDVVGDFLDQPDKRPDPACLRHVGPPDFEIQGPAEDRDDHWERRT